MARQVFDMTWMVSVSFSIAPPCSLTPSQKAKQQQQQQQQQEQQEQQTLSIPSPNQSSFLVPSQAACMQCCAPIPKPWAGESQFANPLLDETLILCDRAVRNVFRTPELLLSRSFLMVGETTVSGL